MYVIMVQASGNGLYLHKRYIIEKHGIETFNKILEIVNEDARKVLSGSVSSNTMYDVNVMNELLRAFVIVVSHDKLKDMAEYTVQKQLSGLYGIFVKFMTFERMAKLYKTYWRKFYSEGELDYTANKDFTDIVFTISNFTYSNEVIYGSMYYIQAILEAVSKKKIISSFKRIDDRTTEYHYVMLLSKESKTST